MLVELNSWFTQQIYWLLSIHVFPELKQHKTKVINLFCYGLVLKKYLIKTIYEFLSCELTNQEKSSISKKIMISATKIK